MRKSSAFLALPALAALGAVALAGCDTDHTKIGDIDSNPDHFAGRDVRIGGRVTEVYELPLGIANIAAYRVSDGTGEIWVISHNGAPARGDRVGLKGTARPIDREDAPFVHNLLGDVVEEHQRKLF